MTELAALRGFGRGAFFLLAVLLGAGALPAAAAPPDGAPLYFEHCAGCHGRTGQGSVGIPLALPAFLAQASDDYLAATIRLGRPGRVMPAFAATLTEPEIRAIVGHLRSASANPAPVYGAGRIAGDAARGAAIYRQHCAVCHGAQGEGGRGTGVTVSRPRMLPIMAPSLANAGFQQAATDSMIARVIREGRAGTPMVGAAARGLSERDVNDIVAHVRTMTPPRLMVRAEDEPAVLVRESPYDVPTTVRNVQAAAAGKNFRPIRVQTLDHGMVDKAREDARRTIVYFCNFEMLNEALGIDPRAGLFLPCRVTVYERDGKVYAMTINPKRLGAAYNNAALAEACDRMHGIYEAILDEATL